jgi:hypothetical protein
MDISLQMSAFQLPEICLLPFSIYKTMYGTTVFIASYLKNLDQQLDFTFHTVHGFVDKLS